MTEVISQNVNGNAMTGISVEEKFEAALNVIRNLPKDGNANDGFLVLIRLRTIFTLLNLFGDLSLLQWALNLHFLTDHGPMVELGTFNTVSFKIALSTNLSTKFSGFSLDMHVYNPILTINSLVSAPYLNKFFIREQFNHL